MSKKRKTTARDRPQFRRDLRAFLEKAKPEIGELTSDAILVCTKAADWDASKNKLWELETNQSSPRADVVCFRCKAPLVVSNHAYARYTAMDKKPKTACMQCVLEAVTG